MLLELHVRNLALIERADVELGNGLNILTGETGAGKSIIIGSVNLALGGKAPKDIIRTGAEYALAELVFQVTEPSRLEALKGLDIQPDEDGILIISRKIMPTRSVSKVNDETVTAARLRQITGLLLDIHGQHEHQSLLYPSKHLEILDAYGKSHIQTLKQEISACYQEYKDYKAALDEAMTDDESRRREMDFLRFEIEEIETAGLKNGEEEELSAQYRKYVNGQKIMGGLSAAWQAVQSDTLSRALKEVTEVRAYDDSLQPICDQLYDAEAILNDISHAISDYMEDVSFDEEEFKQIEERLDIIHHIQDKYGEHIEQVQNLLAQKRERLEKLEHYDEFRAETEAKLRETEKRLDGLCSALTEKRKECAGRLTEQIRTGLEELNFLDVKFTMEFGELSRYTAGGRDEAEFMISTNPGEPVRPLGTVASGGELSRIMLAIKTVLADSDDIPTLIFDEIDTGISGRTAQKVSEKLAVIARRHQVICITHLPQIAAMADTHFEIEKSADTGRTTTRIHRLSYDEMLAELARMLGGAEITDSVLQTAKEMKNLADRTK